MPTEQVLNKQLRINAVIKGLVLGVILLAASIFSYYFITTLTKTMWLIVAGPYFFAIIIPLAVTIVFCRDMRRKLGGYWDFRQSITAVFIMFLTCYVLLTIGRDLVFAKLVEPDMAQKTAAVMLNVKTEALKMQHASQKEIDSQITELRKEFDMQKTMGAADFIQTFIINILMLFMLSIIFGAIFKKQPPHNLQANRDVAG